MAFLPFYIPAAKRLKVVIVGGGYAGIAALTALKHYMPDIDITIIDPKAQHLKITHLHETFRYPLSDLLVPFADLEAGFGCRHVRAALTFNEDTVRQWQTEKCLVVNEEVLTFDYLILAVGSASRGFDSQEYVLNLQDFTDAAGSALLARYLTAENDKSEQTLSVVGGGATGIQFLFEIQQFLCRQKIRCKIRLINSCEQVLTQFPDGFDTYVQSRMRDLGIDYYPNTYYLGQQAGKILLKNKQTGEQFALSSDVSLLFLGKKQENLFAANAVGQLVVDRKPLDRIYVAGDCAYYNAFGSNALTAQSAVRKGKLVARNILRHSGRLKILEPYLHRDIGYVVSLGSADAVGWLVAEGNIVTGLPALTIKEIVETQYDLLLMGIDTYII
ncbi:MAG: NADH dehydrogenase [Nitrosomonas sp.]|nr:MAG: NADH dehydrogenase [Nitrosomonas sp.]